MARRLTVAPVGSIMDSAGVFPYLR
ncbi:hypothetical protein SEA_BOERSMA_49 [Arthrobacter phage Boersma]|uniref:Uncharacterized protein n=4 Tax=Amigovirus amigo TaxID=1982100 RepID=A0A5J6TDB9_9CAUD|nr:hypothetical protein SEA_YEEZUS_47 [Arthrobacter phage Yeezus]QFG13435.1 hypothetical protein SEA_ICHOR_47 [Arthrobacter phage Ichor]QFG13953.1 hypothetical protein SEA_JAEK_47 [Arthrobacter phage Jaek]QJD51740.1 hypothetical protein SEA_BOERSMA_49 [Arthrobacter phage Boersma]